MYTVSGGGLDQSFNTSPCTVSIVSTLYPSGAPGSPRAIKLRVATLASSVFITCGLPVMV